MAQTTKLCNSPHLPVTACPTVSPSPCVQMSTLCVLNIMRQTKNFVREMFECGGPNLFPLQSNFYNQRYSQIKYVAT